MDCPGADAEPTNGGYTDDAVISQQNAIEKEIAEKQNYLIGTLENFETLKDEYSQDCEFLKRIEELEQEYKCVRRTRADGNCFYRAFGFALFDSLRNDKTLYTSLKQRIALIKQSMLDAGREEYILDEFARPFEEEMESICTDGDYSVSRLEAFFNDDMQSNYLVTFLRLVTSTQLQLEKDFYYSFIEGASSVKEFCEKEVEPVNREADHIHIMALTSATGICVRIFCMERERHNVVTFPNDGQPFIHLLYRPGHYDILYSS